MASSDELSKGRWRAGMWPNSPPPLPELGFAGPIGLWEGGAFVSYELAENQGWLFGDKRLRHPPMRPSEDAWTANERRFVRWEREYRSRRGEIYLQLSRLDLDDKPDAASIGQERVAGAETGPKCCLYFGRVDADDDDPCVGDLELVLQFGDLAQVALFLGTPPAAREQQRERIAAGEFGRAAGRGRCGRVDRGRGRGGRRRASRASEQDGVVRWSALG